MSNCRTCYFCIPYQGKSFTMFQWGTCYHAKRKVNANMTACILFKQRGLKVALKSTPEKRNTYKDKDKNLIPGYTIQEVLGKPMTIIAKREYTWGKFAGLAVKVKTEKDKLAIIEITAQTPIKALCALDMPKPPFFARFVQKTSKDNNDYYTVELLNEETGEIVYPDERNPLPF